MDQRPPQRMERVPLILSLVGVPAGRCGRRCTTADSDGLPNGGPSPCAVSNTVCFGCYFWQEARGLDHACMWVVGGSSSRSHAKERRSRSSWLPIHLRFPLPLPMEGSGSWLDRICFRSSSTRPSTPGPTFVYARVYILSWYLVLIPSTGSFLFNRSVITSITRRLLGSLSTQGFIIHDSLLFRLILITEKVTP